jgi:hypothetical protein
MDSRSTTGTVTRWLDDIKTGDLAAAPAALQPLFREAYRPGPRAALRIAGLESGER